MRGNTPFLTMNEAKKTLIAISRKFFGGKNYNDTHWYEAGVEDKDGSISGPVYQIVEKGKSKEVGTFRIEKSGFVVAFPSVPNEFFKELNTNKEEPKPIAVKSAAPKSDVVTPPDFDNSEVPQERKPKKRRGRPSKS